jgi:tetratricopeptide (TPR) repeat protein
MVRKFVEAIGVYQEALDLWHELPEEEQDKIVHLRLNRKIVDIATEAKWSVDAQTYLQASEISKKSHMDLMRRLEELDDASPHEENVRMLVALSTEAWRVQTPADWISAQRYAQSAVELAEKLANKDLLSSALGALATTLDGQSLLREHLGIANQRVEISRNGDQVTEIEKIDAHRGMGAALMYVGQYAEAIPYLEKAEAMAVEAHSPNLIANAVGIKTQCLFRMDRWDDVLEMEKLWRNLDMRYTREQVGET